MPSIARPKRSFFAFSFLFLGLAFGISINTHGALPPDARAYLKRMPGEALSVELVLFQAIKNADSFQAVLAEQASIENAELAAHAALDPRVTLDASRIVNANEANNPFSAEKTLISSASVSLQKRFFTGTGIQLGFSHGSTDIIYPPALAAFGALAPPTPFETRASVSLSQSLWKDFFGTATRDAMKSGELATRAAELRFKENVSQWVLDLVQIYYQAWLFQEQARAAEEGLKRRKRLLDITQIRARRGTAEKPDLLQIESLVLRSESRLREVRQSLAEIWRALVIALKLPRPWLKIDPIEIPLVLDEPIKEWLKRCDKDPAPEVTRVSEQLELTAQSAALSFDVAKDRLRPDLTLNFGFVTNAYDSDQAPTFSEAFRAENPQWLVGLQFSYPFGHYVEEAQARQAFTDQQRAEALFAQARSSASADWMNLCDNLERLTSDRGRYQRVMKKQLQRADLEARRFQVGRIPILNVIQAEDEATEAELSLHTAEIQARLAAWNLRKFRGTVQDYLESLQSRQKELSP